MNQSIIIAIIAGVLILGYVVLTIVKTKKSKSAKEDYLANKLPPSRPKYKGITADIKNDYHDPKTMQYHIMIDKPIGPSILFAHEELTATQALEQMFKFDSANNINVLSKKSQEEFLKLANHNDKVGWFKYDKNWFSDLAKAKDEIHKAMKTSSCCKVKLPIISGSNDNGAFRCPKCNKFCKAI